MEHAVWERWSDAVFVRCCAEARGIDLNLLILGILWRSLREALENPTNWKRVRIPRDARTRRQAARVTRALRRSSGMGSCSLVTFAVPRRYGR